MFHVNVIKAVHDFHATGSRPLSRTFDIFLPVQSQYYGLTNFLSGYDGSSNGMGR
jgi:hypothetical protein